MATEQHLLSTPQPHPGAEGNTEDEESGFCFVFKKKKANSVWFLIERRCVVKPPPQ